jgi:phosphoribosylformimino-5-aminoimidazole carboxamide ribotide isomerase
MWLIPAIDLKAGRCVRLYKGDFAEETRYSIEPQELLLKYQQLGAEWLHVVDLDGAQGAGKDNRDIILSLAATGSIKLQVGGGLRNTVAVAQMLDGGATRVVIGSAAVSQVEQVQAWMQHFGPERLTLAFDVRIAAGDEPRVTVQGWQQQSDVTLWAAVQPYLSCGLKHVLCTDVDRDGALGGPNVELYGQAVARFPQIEWQASGGIRDAADLSALHEVGAAAAISGKALLENLIPSGELQPFLRNASSPV